ncbi:hypothetical protein D3C87_2183350 [compost metagenome]
MIRIDRTAEGQFKTAASRYIGCKIGWTYGDQLYRRTPHIEYPPLSTCNPGKSLIIVVYERTRIN